MEITMRKLSEEEFRIVKPALINYFNCQNVSNGKTKRIFAGGWGFIAFWGIMSTIPFITKAIREFNIEELLVYSIGTLPFLILLLFCIKKIINPCKDVKINKDDYKIASGVITKISKSKGVYWGMFSDDFGGVFEDEVEIIGDCIREGAAYLIEDSEGYFLVCY